MCHLSFEQQLQSCWFRATGREFPNGDRVKGSAWCVEVLTESHWVCPPRLIPCPGYFSCMDLSFTMCLQEFPQPVSPSQLAVKLQQSSPRSNVENCTETAAFMQLNDHSFKYPLSSRGLTLFTDQLHSKQQHGLHGLQNQYKWDQKQTH